MQFTLTNKWNINKPYYYNEWNYTYKLWNQIACLNLNPKGNNTFLCTYTWMNFCCIFEKPHLHSTQSKYTECQTKALCSLNPLRQLTKHHYPWRSHVGSPDGWDSSEAWHYDWQPYGTAVNTLLSVNVAGKCMCECEECGFLHLCLYLSMRLCNVTSWNEVTMCVCVCDVARGVFRRYSSKPSLP